MRARLALGASVLLHATIFVALSLMPEPPRPEPTEQLTIVELLELPEQRPAPRQPAPRPADSSSPDTPSDPGDSEASAPQARDRPSLPSAQNAPDSQAVEPPSAATGDTEPAGVEDASPAPSGLAISGLRGERAGVTSPRLSSKSAVTIGRPDEDALVGPSRADAGEPATPAEAGFVRKKDGRWIYRDPEPSASWTAELLADGRLRFKDHLTPQADPRGGLNGVRMPGLTDLANQSRGVRYWMQRKRRLLARTKKMRMKMAIAFAEQNIDRQLRRLDRDLLAIWTSDRPPHTRRGLLFDIWDECDEHVEVKAGELDDAEAETEAKIDRGALDELRRNAGERARKTIVVFIRRHLPQGSRHAYSPEELRELNSRRLSSERFDPYATRG